MHNICFKEGHKHAVVVYEKPYQYSANVSRNIGNQKHETVGRYPVEVFHALWCYTLIQPRAERVVILVQNTIVLGQLEKGVLILTTSTNSAGN